MLAIVLWGTGGNARDFLASAVGGGFSVVGCVDNDPQRQGGRFEGLPVHAPTELPRLRFDYLVIASHAAGPIRTQALGLSVPSGKILSTAHVISLQLLAAGHPLAGQAVGLETTGWHHAFELLPGVRTLGAAPLRQALLDDAFLGDVAGRRMLVLGARDGAYAFDLERRGAAEVVAFDFPETRSHAFNFAVTMRDSKVTSMVGFPELLAADSMGKYDAVCLYEMQGLPRHPLELLGVATDRLRVGGTLYFESLAAEFLRDGDARAKETEGADNQATDGGWALSLPAERLGYAGEGLAHVPSMACLRAWIEDAGLSITALSRDASGDAVHGKAVKTRRTARRAVHAPGCRTSPSRRKLCLVYIAGAPRSGTTYLQRTLREAEGCGGIDDEQYLDLFASVLRDVERDPSNAALDAHFDVFFTTLQKYAVPRTAAARVTPAVFAQVGLCKNFRMLGADLLDRIVAASLAPDTRFYVANRPFPEPSYMDDLAFYCQESGLFRELRCILPVRHPLEVWASGCLKFPWWREERWPFSMVLGRWFAVYEAARERGGLFVDYNRLKENPQATIDALAARLGLPKLTALPFRASSVAQVELRLSRSQQVRIDRFLQTLPFIA
ncbi:hypothetical protein DesfrDRAFT_3312 [Solidesulfovibrio fructosivorans JJ]]|uniref:Uncharacterized protein n=1 Tax=Solidesulfovibrio fructosivorans JJ] TaxID=596151 RepID=E1K0B2_SOLFR|nr:class I SAM-dependent methyltransferase [Solidesulfovibrio fructosivorans]EFL49943.1 hypothetical protein DesfrDRAFT_3312 [Solidesulfovibrio fructosivorans JJ]]